MQDHKALQAGTTHFLGQNFSKAQEIKFQDQSGQEIYAWTTSWGVSTRLIGCLIMTHSDDDGLVVPPKLAPAHLVILPIYRNDDERQAVLAYCETLQKELAEQRYDGSPLRVRLDDRDLRSGEKKWQWVKRGVPLRVEVGPRDVKEGNVFVGRRDVAGKGQPIVRERFVATLADTLDEIQENLFQRALSLREKATRRIDDLAEFEAFFTPDNSEKPEIHGGLALCHFVDCEEMEATLKKLKVTVRCVPIDGDIYSSDEPGKCLFSGQASKRRGVFAKAY